MCPRMFTYSTFLHWIINDVEILEVATDVVCEIDAMGWEATRCSPVSGVTLQRPHSCQTQAVHIPVMGILVDWSVILKGSHLRSWSQTIFVRPGHHQGPCSTRLGLKITVSWETVASGVVKPVHTACRSTSKQVIKAGSRPFILWLRTAVSLEINILIPMLSLTLSFDDNYLFIIISRVSRLKISRYT